MGRPEPTQSGRCKALHDTHEVEPTQSSASILLDRGVARFVRPLQLCKPGRVAARTLDVLNFQNIGSPPSSLYPAGRLVTAELMTAMGTAATSLGVSLDVSNPGNSCKMN